MNSGTLVSHWLLVPVCDTLPRSIVYGSLGQEKGDTFANY